MIVFYSFRIRRRVLVSAGAFLLFAAVGGAAAFFLGAAPVGCSTEDLAPANARALPADAASKSPGQSGSPATEETPAEQEKVVYLTFDDGPSATTEIILDILKQEAVPATFFVIAAENNEEHLPLLSRMVEEAHTIALHTCTHEYKKIYASPEAYWADIDALKEKISPYVPAAEIHWLRFPGGSTNTVSHKYGGSGIMRELKAQAEEKGYRYIDWNVCANDAVGGHPSAEKIYNNVVRGVGKRSTCVVLMHDTKETRTTADALPQIIKWFKNAGYRFDTVDHLTKQI